jgi:hypothetical protein
MALNAAHNSLIISEKNIKNFLKKRAVWHGLCPYKSVLRQQSSLQYERIDLGSPSGGPRLLATSQNKC